MNRTRTFSALLVIATLLLGISVYAQVTRPYRPGSVWDIAFIRVKPGMSSAYYDYLASDWKRNQETMKKEGLILSYKIIETESHGANDWNLMLMTEFKDLASLEAGEQRADAVIQRVVGNDERQRQGYRDRLEIREVVGNRLAREIVLEPRKPSM